MGIEHFFAILFLLAVAIPLAIIKLIIDNRKKIYNKYKEVKEEQLKNMYRKEYQEKILREKLKKEVKEEMGLHDSFEEDKKKNKHRIFSVIYCLH
ncbi:hypothetical protein [Desulfonema limicola]|uniref:hypothetical protein n=1 Tax=Desulfonema limicola TaxID=45656 RepID=UPI001A9BAF9C|nr:hypothetical protein [Desulfonema limicola]